MKPEELKTILDDHAKWLRGEGGERANLRWANLSYADLSVANLSWADLSGARLSGASLRGADLSWANLSGADLSGASLRLANLNWADLSVANLRWADLRWASLSRASLRGADLSWANLSGANLSGAKVDAAICRMDFGGWSICVYADKTSIGCKTHANEDWLAWMPDSADIVRMHTEASAWWATHGEAIKAVIRCVQANAKGGEA